MHPRPSEVLFNLVQFLSDATPRTLLASTLYVGINFVVRGPKRWREKLPSLEPDYITVRTVQYGTVPICQLRVWYLVLCVLRVQGAIMINTASVFIFLISNFTLLAA